MKKTLRIFILWGSQGATATTPVSGAGFGGSAYFRYVLAWCFTTPARVSAPGSPAAVPATVQDLGPFLLCHSLQLDGTFFALSLAHDLLQPHKKPHGRSLALFY